MPFRIRKSLAELAETDVEGWRLRFSAASAVTLTRALGPADRATQLVGAALAAVTVAAWAALVFMEIASRRVIFVNCSAHADAASVTQQARNVAWELADLDHAISFLIRDRDSKFTSSFDSVFAASGTKVLRTPFRTPRANAT